MIVLHYGDAMGAAFPRSFSLCLKLGKPARVIDSEPIMRLLWPRGSGRSRPKSGI